MKKLFFLQIISLLFLAGCNSLPDDRTANLELENKKLSEENISYKALLEKQDATSKEALFEKTKECKLLEKQILDELASDILMQIFYSPQLNSCLYVTKTPFIENNTYFIYNYFESSLVDSTSFYQTLEKKINELKG